MLLVSKVYACKARIYKHVPVLKPLETSILYFLPHVPTKAGDLESSAKCYEEALTALGVASEKHIVRRSQVRQMDLADRYLNTQCVR